MLRASMACAVAIFAAAFGAAAPILFAQPADPAQDVVDQLNYVRAAVGLDPVVLDTNGAAAAHAQYLALNNGRGDPRFDDQREDPALPGYTPEGAAIARYANLAFGMRDPVAALIGMLSGPVSRHWLLAPGLANFGVGAQSGFTVFDVSQGELTPWQGAPVAVEFPPPDSSGALLAFVGGQYPITLDLWGCTPTDIDASLSSNGADVPVYLGRPGTDLGGGHLLRSVVLVPRTQLTPSTTYSVTVDATCGPLGSNTYAWSFTTSEAPREQVPSPPQR